MFAYTDYLVVKNLNCNNQSSSGGHNWVQFEDLHTREQEVTTCIATRPRAQPQVNVGSINVLQTIDIMWDVKLWSTTSRIFEEESQSNLLATNCLPCGESYKHIL